MNRYFRSSHKTVKIENYLNNCKLGDWFVLYQLSKNLNRPFFMDFLTTLSVRFAHGHVCDEEDPEETGALLNQMGNYLKPSAKAEKCKSEIAADKGDNFIEMITQPKIIDEPDGKDDKKTDDDKDKDDGSDDDDDEDGDDDKKDDKKTDDDKDKDDGRLDLPEGGDGLLSRAKRASSESLEKTTGYKASKGKSAGKSYSKR